MEKNASATYGRALASDRSLMFKGLLINAARRAFALLSAAALLCSVSACAEVVPTDSCSHTPPPMQTDSKQEAALELMAVSEPPPETEPETEPPRTEPAPPPEPVQQEEHENSVTYSEPEPTYINGILIVNKTYALPSSYGGGADPTALAAVNEMIAAAAEEGLNLFIIPAIAAMTSRQISTATMSRATVRRLLIGIPRAPVTPNIRPGLHLT